MTYYPQRCRRGQCEQGTLGMENICILELKNEVYEDVCDFFQSISTIVLNANELIIGKSFLSHKVKLNLLNNVF